MVFEIEISMKENNKAGNGQYMTNNCFLNS